MSNVKDSRRDTIEDIEMLPSISQAEGHISTPLLYGVDDTPNVLLLILLGFQQAILAISPSMTMSFVVSNQLCAEDQPDVKAILLSTALFMCGLATIMQCMFGVRIGIAQGSSFAFIAPIVAMMTLDEWKCPETGEDRDKWKINIREIQGNLLLASLTQVLLGLTGTIGFLMRFIGPLTIAPTITLVGFSLCSFASDFGEEHWGIFLLSMVLILLFSLFLDKVNVPIPSWSKGIVCHKEGLPLFQYFPILLGTVLTWIFCHILTVTDALPRQINDTGYYARTDVKLFVLDNSPWLYWPYPFQFGYPTVSAAGFVGMLAATMASLIESLGDYYAAARISMVPPPPAHAINRGVVMEGLASIVAGMIGSPYGTTSYSNCIGAIGLTKVASRNVFIMAGVILLICGIFGKVGGLLCLIPDPIIGGNLAVQLGLSGATGISVLKYVHLDSIRNLTIIGVSLFLGFMLPDYINDPKHSHRIDTGSMELDHVLKVLLGTSMFVGGFVGMVLDNSVPGTPEERGIIAMNDVSTTNVDQKIVQSTHMYDLPLVTDCFRGRAFCSYVPISPSYGNKPYIIGTCCQRKCVRDDDDEEGYESSSVKDV